MLFNAGIVGGQASGSVGGVTASHNRFGTYLRNRSVPVNPNSSRQQVARNRFTTAAGRWSSILTQAQRDAWILYADNVDWINRIGQTVNLTGLNMYLRSVTAELAAALPIVDDGPTTFSLPDIDPAYGATISEATQLISVSFDNTEAWANEDDAALLIEMSIPQGAGRTFLSPQSRVAGAILGDSTTPPTSPTTLAVPFAVAEGQKVNVSARVIRADGRVSAPFLDTAIIAA